MQVFEFDRENHANGSMCWCACSIVESSHARLSQIEPYSNIVNMASYEGWQGKCVSIAMDVPFWWLLVAVFDHVAATNISYAQYFGSGCVSGEREFTCSVSGETLCCQHESQTHGWYCQGSFVNRKDFPGGQDCSGQASQEIVGFLSDTTSIGNINAGECIDYGNTMSFKQLACMRCHMAFEFLIGFYLLI